MSVKRPRSYNSPQRNEQANATRRAILNAAEELFAERGYGAVTMTHIASAAGVSVATVYLHFPNKATIVAGLADAITTSPDLSVEQLEGEPDPVALLRLGAGIIRRLNERSWLVADILRGAHGTDSSLEAIWVTWQARHLDAIRRAIAALQERDALRVGFDFGESVDTFYALASTDVYRILVRERSWTPRQYEDWLFRLAYRELLEGVGS